MSTFNRSWTERAPATHPLSDQVAGRSVELAIGGDSEVARVVVAAYRVASSGGEWDPEAGRPCCGAIIVVGSECWRDRSRVRTLSETDADGDEGSV